MTSEEGHQEGEQEGRGVWWPEAGGGGGCGGSCSSRGGTAERLRQGHRLPATPPSGRGCRAWRANERASGCGGFRTGDFGEGEKVGERRVTDTRVVLSHTAGRHPQVAMSMEIKLQIQVPGHTSHVSSAPRPHVAGAGRIGPRRHGAFPSVRKVLQGGPGPKRV